MMRKIIVGFSVLLSAVLLSAAALAQGTVLQGGPTGPGRVPMYSSPRTSQPIILDSGTAAGGPAGVGLSELLLAARGVGTPPYVAQGSGPFGTNNCMYDAPITNATGYHYLCFSANAQGGGLLAYGAGGSATQLPFSFNINGVAYQFPFSATGSCGGVFASGELCANAGGSSAFPANVTLSALLNRVFGTTPNQLLYNNAGAWSALPSANNAVLVTNGTGVPSFSTSLPAAMFANPTAQVALTAINGVALTAMRSDAAPALNTGISPGWGGVHTFAHGIRVFPPAPSLEGSFTVAMALSGDAGTTFLPVSTFRVNSDNVNMGTTSGNALTAWLFTHNFGGSALAGARVSVGISSEFTAPANPADTNSLFLAFAPSMIIDTHDNGTGLTSGTAKGSFGTANHVTIAKSGAVFLNAIGTIEFNVSAQAGSSVRYKSGIQVAAGYSDAVQGTQYDCAFCLSVIETAVGWKNGFLIGPMNNDANVHPISTTGTIFGTVGSSTVDKAFDVSSYTITTCALKIAFGCVINGAGAHLGTSMTAPLDIGGSGTTGTQKTYQTTTGAGTTDQYAWQGGNNGATNFALLSALAYTLPARLVLNGNQTLATSGIGVVDISGTITNNSGQMSSLYAHQTFNGSADVPTGFWVDTTFSPSSSIATARTLQLIGRSVPGAGVTITDVQVAYLTLRYNGVSTGTQTNGTTLLLDTISGSGNKPTTHYGARINNQGLSGVTTSYGLYIDSQSGSTTNYGLYSLENLTIGAATKTLTLKQGANGAVGTFICTSGGSITVTNSFVAVTDTIIISLNTAGGTISNAPALNAITASTSFVAKCATSDTSTYNYAIIKNAA